MARDSDVARQSNLELKYKKQQQLKDAFFGEFYVYNDSANDSKIICIEKLLSDKEALKREIEQIKKKILNKHDYILNLLDYSVEVQSNLCSTFYLLKTFYEHPNKSLKKEINERKLQGGSTGNFKNTDLTHLLYHQVMAHSYLQDNKVTHGDISPNTIFISNKGDYKVAFRLNNSLSIEKVQLEKLMKNEPVYLSPALYSALKRRNLNNIMHSSLKSDIFSFGLCMLEAGLLRSIQSIYAKGDEIDQHMLNIYLDEFEMKFADNPLLFSSVRKMCEIDEGDRPSFTDLKLALPDYAEICDYFYKVEHGLINEEEDGWDENSPDPNNNFQSNYDYNGSNQQDHQYNMNNPNTQHSVNNFNNPEYGQVQQSYQEVPRQQQYTPNVNNGYSLSNPTVQVQQSYQEVPKQQQYTSNLNNGYNLSNPTIQVQNSTPMNNYSQPVNVSTTNKPVGNSNNTFYEKYADYDFFNDTPVNETPKSYTPNTFTYGQHQTNSTPINVQSSNDGLFTPYTPVQPKVSYSNTNNGYNNTYAPKRPDSTQTYVSTTLYSNDNTAYGQNQAYGQPHTYGQNNTYGRSQPYVQEQHYGQQQSYGQPQAHGQNQQFYRGY